MTSLDVPVPYRVVDTVQETGSVTTLWAQPFDGVLPPFEPAQFSMIGIAGLGDVPVSISSPVTNRIAHSFTIKSTGAVTQQLSRSAIGDIVTVRGPMGTPWNLDAANGRHVLFVAGGVGIAPLRAAIHRAVDDMDRFGGVTLLYGATTPGGVVFRDWLESLPSTGAEAQLTVDRLSDQIWKGHVGLVTDLIAAAVRPGTVAYICGPDPMMGAAIDALRAEGVPPGDIQVTLERNMYCGYGTCGHCQLGKMIVCRDGPVATAAQLGDALRIREL